jgi:hypothetical protein
VGGGLIIMTIDESRIAKTGEWFHDGSIRCRILIQSETCLPGSGDHHDPEKIANDRDIPCFSIWYENPAQKGNYNAGGGYRLTLEEAMRSVEAAIEGHVTWK